MDKNKMATKVTEACEKQPKARLWLAKSGFSNSNGVGFR